MGAKRKTAALLCSALLLSLAGCGGSSKSAQTQTVAPATQATNPLGPKPIETGSEANKEASEEAGKKAEEAKEASGEAAKKSEEAKEATEEAGKKSEEASEEAGKKAEEAKEAAEEKH